MKKKKSRGRPSFEPTPQQRGEVKALSIAGFGQDEIARYLDVDAKTLRLHFRKELDSALMSTLGSAAMNVVRAALGAPAQYDDAGNRTREEVAPQAWALCFLLKTRGKRIGWTERDQSKDAAASDSVSGKKAKAAAEAQRIVAEGGKFAPGSPPKLVVNNQ